jgi:hypothetical protein
MRFFNVWSQETQQAHARDTVSIILRVVRRSYVLAVVTMEAENWLLLEFGNGRKAQEIDRTYPVSLDTRTDHGEQRSVAISHQSCDMPATGQGNHWS